MALLILLAIIIAAVSLLLFTPARIELQLLLTSCGVRWRVRLRAMAGLARFCGDSENGRELDRDARKAKLTRFSRHLIARAIAPEHRYPYLERISVRGRVGVENDAAATALLSGGLTGLFLALPQAALPCKQKPEADVKPEFRMGTLWLYMEGMVVLLPAKIIAILIKTIVSEVKGNVASGRKHYEKHHGAAQADGGR